MGVFGSLFDRITFLLVVQSLDNHLSLFLHALALGLLFLRTLYYIE
jgi:hypothetical protein